MFKLADQRQYDGALRRHRRAGGSPPAAGILSTILKTTAGVSKSFAGTIDESKDGCRSIRSQLKR
jgi:hypothetical protein